MGWFSLLCGMAIVAIHQCHCGRLCFQPWLREYIYVTSQPLIIMRFACLPTERWHLCFLRVELGEAETAPTKTQQRKGFYATSKAQS